MELSNRQLHVLGRHVHALEEVYVVEDQVVAQIAVDVAWKLSRTPTTPLAGLLTPTFVYHLFPDRYRTLLPASGAWPRIYLLLSIEGLTLLILQICSKARRTYWAHPWSYFDSQAFASSGIRV